MTAPVQPAQQALDDFIKAAEAHHERYVRSLRSLHDGTALRRTDSQPRSITTIPEPFTPPLRALSVPTFASGSDAPLGTSLRRRPRAATLETTAELPTTTCAAFSHDDDVAFIPLLDTASAPSLEPVVPIRRPLTPMRWPDAALLRHLRDA
ncbi:hypothetical protein AK830_g12588, partial [Neonectria ditissima]